MSEAFGGRICADNMNGFHTCIVQHALCHARLAVTSRASLMVVMISSIADFLLL